MFIPDKLTPPVFRKNSPSPTAPVIVPPVPIAPLRPVTVNKSPPPGPMLSVRVIPSESESELLTA